MRVGSTLYYVLKDHLGSASVLTDASGVPVANADVRYLPFGDARSSTAPMLTDKLFTGQRLIADLGIYHYGVRFYSAKLGRFLSPDITITDPTNPQNLNRFSYVLNNPLLYTDPTGFTVDCGIGENCEELISQTLKENYNWKIKGRLKLKELDTIYRTARDIQTYVDKLTGGKGKDWIQAFLGNTDFEHWAGVNNQTWPGWATGTGNNTVYITDRYFTERWIVHELGHIWDINTANATPVWGAVGGVADELNTLIGGNVQDPKIDCRWCEGSGINHIPESSRYSGDAYANKSTADYLAETFTFEIYPEFNPGGGIGTVAASSWVKIFIMSQALGMP